MRGLVVGVVVGLLVAVAGCSSEPEKTKDDVGKSASPSPTASPEPKRLIDKAPPKPKVPKMAETDESAIAYAKYASDVHIYAYGQSNSAPFAELIDPKGCLDCAKSVKAIDSFGELIGVPLTPVEIANARVTGRNKPYRTVRLNRKVSGFGVIDPAKPNRYAQRLKGFDGEVTINMRWADSQWLLAGFQSGE